MLNRAHASVKGWKPRKDESKLYQLLTTHHKTKTRTTDTFPTLGSVTKQQTFQCDVMSCLGSMFSNDATNRFAAFIALCCVLTAADFFHTTWNHLWQAPRDNGRKSLSEQFCLPGRGAHLSVQQLAAEWDAVATCRRFSAQGYAAVSSRVPARVLWLLDRPPVVAVTLQPEAMWKQTNSM